jgi:hypothetical protein
MKPTKDMNLYFTPSLFLKKKKKIESPHHTGPVTYTKNGFSGDE